MLERARTILNNMAWERDDSYFNSFFWRRWVISAEPLRADAQKLLPEIDKVLRDSPESRLHFPRVAAAKAVEENAIGKACYVMSEMHLSGYRVLVGFNTLQEAQDAVDEIIERRAARKE
jgi:hypothetical protein